MNSRIIALTILLLLSGAARAGAPQRVEALARVTVRIVPQLTITQVAQVAHVGTVTTGRFGADVDFRIDANVDHVKVQVMATGLHHDGAAQSPHVIPIAGDGPTVQPESGSATDLLTWTGVDTLNDMPARVSSIGLVKSAQKDRFAQEVSVSIEYDQNRTDLLRGEYSGYVKLVTYILPR